MTRASLSSDGIGAREAAPAPLLVSIPETRRQLGNIGNTAFYAAVKRHNIKLVKIGSRSLVPASEIKRVVAEVIAAADITATVRGRVKAKALAARSVASRKAKQAANQRPMPAGPAIDA